MGDWVLLLESAREFVLPEAMLLVLAIAATLLAAIGRRRSWESSKWLSTVGIAAPIAALGLLLIDMSFSHRRMLEIRGLLGSVMPPVSLDQESTALARQGSLVRELLGFVLGSFMPIATWVWGRVHWPEPDRRGLRRLALLAAVVVTVTGWGIASWSLEFMYPGFGNSAGCAPNGWHRVDASFAGLEQARTRVVVGGVLVAVLAVVLGVLQARRGRMLRMEDWVPLLAFVSVAGIAKLATTDERHDTEAAFGNPPKWHHGWPVLKGHADDPHQGPRLDHCTFDYESMNLLDTNHRWWGDVERWGEWIDVCAPTDGIGPILAEPELAIGDIVPSLQSARDHGYRRFGVASLRPIATERATTGEFLRLQLCVVEFSVADDGLPIERFATWGDLAAAADAAEGALVVALTSDSAALPRTRDRDYVPPRGDEDDVPSLWAPYLELPDRDR